jgi:membrane glycosyltransferase
MDSITSVSAPAEFEAHAGNQPASALASMPTESPMAMPVQSLTRFDRRTRRTPVDRSANWWTFFSRLITFGGGFALTAYGAYEMFGVINVGAITLLKWLLLVLFVINFSWIAVSFCASVAGALWLLTVGRRKLAPVAKLTSRTAVVMPIYNESPDRVYSAMQAMMEEVHATGQGENFDWFLLSDSTNPDVWIEEERQFALLRERIGDKGRVYYRHRPKNTARKTGNIADFVTRWGGAYDHMLVLDADSLLTAETILRLTAAMEADPDAAIIQSPPLIINRNTLLARLHQFAARFEGPIVSAGLQAWSGTNGNYWGHNAVIRMKAFAEHCGLPDLRGKPPFGGHIMSHDFIEAALLRRAGYSVYMLPALTGSYEESPPSLIDLALRDRRWCQGNLQHIRIIMSKGFTLATRQHIAAGIFSYLASPFWLAQLLVGLILVLQSTYIRPEYFTDQVTLVPAWPVFDAERALWLFGVTMAVLLAPKLFGMIVAIATARVRRSSGGALGIFFSTLLEIILSSLYAPIMMLIQTGSVLRILSGRDAGWNPQRRDDGSIPFKDIVRRHFWHTVLGFLTLIAAFLIAPSLAAWMSPTIAGLMLAIILSWASGMAAIGLALKAIGLLRTPEETRPPDIARRAAQIYAEIHDGEEPPNALRAIHADPALRETHERFLPPAPPHVRGQIDPNRAIAEAKLNDAQSLEEAVAWLKPAECNILLHDRALIDVLARLPAAGTAKAA